MTMERYRIEWREGPTLIGGDSWVIDLDLLVSIRSSPFRLAKRLQVVAPLEDLDDVAELDWRFWRALVSVAARSVIKSITDEQLHLDRPRQPFQLVPDVSEAVRRRADMDDQPVQPAELVSELTA
jgi:hypothetical protein